MSPATAEQVRSVFDAHLCKGELEPSATLDAAAAAMRKILERWLALQGAMVITWAMKQLPDDADAPQALEMWVRAAKLLDDDEAALDAAVARLEKASGEVPIDDPGDLADDLADAAMKAAGAGAAETAASLGIKLGEPPKAALDYARDRAGDLVGKKWIGGQWIDSPNPFLAIDDTTRTFVRETVTKAINDGWSPGKLASTLAPQFGTARAEKIARTETGFAYGKGAAVVYRDAGVDLLGILDGPGCIPDGHDDDALEPDGDAIGVVQFDRQANGQVWTVEQYEQHLLGHPHCVRGAVVYAPGI